MGKTLIKNAHIADFTTLTSAKKDIRIADGRITEIAENLHPHPDEAVVEAHGMLALPGLVDTHTHMIQTYQKGPLDDIPITRWLGHLFRNEGMMTDEDTYYSALVGCLQSLRYGVTTINEMTVHEHIDSIVEGYTAAGIRATFGVSTNDISENPDTVVRTVDQNLKIVEDLMHKYHLKNNGMLRTSAAPPGLPAGSERLMKELKAFTNKNGLIFHTHLAEGKKETEDVKARTGFWEGEALYEFGLLDEKTVLAHSIWLQDFELDLIAKSGANVAHCPCTNMKISDGIPKIYGMLQRGINVAMGCDGEASSSNRDILLEAKIGSYLQKAVTLDPLAMGPKEALYMMTRNGAKALGYEDLGEIKVGNKADIVLFCTDDVSLTNRGCRVGNLFYAGTGRNADTVFVEGRMVLRGGQFVHVDLQAIMEKYEQLHAAFLKRIQIQ